MERAAQYPMAVVTRRTGLRADVIRAWERRYGAVEPTRTTGNHRLYSDADIRRLLLLRQALDAGWQIGRVGTLPDDEIEELIRDADAPTSARHAAGTESREQFLELCLRSVERMDAGRLRLELDRAAVEFGRIRLLDQLLGPLMERIGDSCADGTLRIAHEHLASSTVRAFLENLRGAFAVSEHAPTVVVTTPAFQHHELAAIVVSAAARIEAWRATYLGPNLPAEEIAAAVQPPAVRMLALSITSDPEDDADLDQELRRIGRLVRKGVGIVVGGRASAGYRGALEAIGATRISDLGKFRDHLREVRGEHE